MFKVRFLADRHYVPESGPGDTVTLARFDTLPFVPQPGMRVGFERNSTLSVEDFKVMWVLWNHPLGRFEVGLEERRHARVPDMVRGLEFSARQGWELATDPEIDPHQHPTLEAAITEQKRRYKGGEDEAAEEAVIEASGRFWVIGPFALRFLRAADPEHPVLWTGARLLPDPGAELLDLLTRRAGIQPTVIDAPPSVRLIGCDCSPGASVQLEPLSQTLGGQKWATAVGTCGRCGVYLATAPRPTEAGR